MTCAAAGFGLGRCPGRWSSAAGLGVSDGDGLVSTRQIAEVADEDRRIDVERLSDRLHVVGLRTSVRSDGRHDRRRTACVGDVLHAHVAIP
jgi:hypothetical protein